MLWAGCVCSKQLMMIRRPAVAASSLQDRCYECFSWPEWIEAYRGVSQVMCALIDLIQSQCVGLINTTPRRCDGQISGPLNTAGYRIKHLATDQVLDRPLLSWNVDSHQLRGGG